MSFPIVAPSFIKEFVDFTEKNPDDKDFVNIVVSPAAVEYILKLCNPDIARKVITMTSPMEFNISKIEGDAAKPFLESREKACKRNPAAPYYWQIRTLMMSVLQNRKFGLEKRMFLLNYALKNIQMLVDASQAYAIPQFVNEFIKLENYDDVMQHFKSVVPNPAYSLMDGVSLLKSISTKTPAYKEIMSTIYKNLGVTGIETMKLMKFEKYIELRNQFGEKYLQNNSEIIENILVNYVWKYSIPYNDSDRVNIWDNYLFLCSIYNVIKVLFACYMPGKNEDDMVKALSNFDMALNQIGAGVCTRVVGAIKRSGQANNGDMAVLVLS